MQERYQNKGKPSNPGSNSHSSFPPPSTKPAAKQAAANEGTSLLSKKANSTTVIADKPWWRPW